MVFLWREIPLLFEGFGGEKLTGQMNMPSKFIHVVLMKIKQSSQKCRFHNQRFEFLQRTLSSGLQEKLTSLIGYFTEGNSLDYKTEAEKSARKEHNVSSAYGSLGRK